MKSQGKEKINGTGRRFRRKGKMRRGEEEKLNRNE
jgi:hypothetical protein